MNQYKFQISDGFRGVFELHNETDEYIRQCETRELIDLVCLAKDVNKYNGTHVIFGLWESFIQSDYVPLWVNKAEDSGLVLSWSLV